MYYLTYSLLYLISLLPFWVLYGISYCAYIILYYFIGYRKEVVLSNLSIAFPEKSLDERKAIAKKFYKNFTDNFIEVVKMFSISPAQLQKRITWDYESLNKYYETGKNVQFHLGHFFNWEYANFSVSLESKFQVLVVYRTIFNKAMNKIFIRLRTRFNAKIIAANAFLKEFKPYSKERFCIVFVADQNPSKPIRGYWLPFFGKLAPFVTGPEKTARLTNAICLYVKFKKIKRGYYHVQLLEISDNPKQTAEGDITKSFVKYMEENIREQPETYLWSHRRWRHTYDPEKHRAL
ncbi:MAG TPA: lysophospholipid acyltransferase family protein [Parafilimonas sp.]|nr:lysophospholipid acyltransferase family protein [Parafilimonas sp.]